MAPMFASADIAALVAAFPPPSPTKGQPSLVRTLSGNNLKDSRKVLAGFRTLLETAPSRIRLTDLPSRLEVATTEWLFDCYDGPLYHGADGDIRTQLHNAVLSMTSFASDVDISGQSLDDLIASDRHQDDLQELVDQSAGGKRYLYSRSYAARIVDRVQSTVADKQSEGIDLTQMYPEVPNALLKALADSAVDGLPAEEGRFEVMNGRVVFVPIGYATRLEGKQRVTRDRQIQELVDRLRDKGYCPVSAETEDGAEVVQAVQRLIAEQGGEAVAEIVATDSRAVLLVQPKQLDQAVETVRLTTPQETARIWHERDSSRSILALQDAVIRSLVRHLTSEIALMLLRSTHREEVESIIADSLAKLEAEDQDHFSQAVRERLVAPVGLYANGIATVAELTLKQHQEEYLGDHFRREVIPAFVLSLREARLLIDKNRRRDIEKMQAACAEAKTLADIQTSVMRLAKRQKLDVPDAELMAEVKRLTLQQKVKAMKKMTRGSDLLQNLTWVLLAQRSDGLFMSSGKDTTRMIKLYQAVGDTEVGRKLEGWRDMLKAGKEQRGDLQEMREEAVRAVEEVCGADGERADG
ncbi:hypothetical protein LTR36_009051 [Oleoguttula mirabilis]|uniref:Uncharacterized protein n=1 Tax=Oleoguttula mirabilis TaxID=1507867 RepID=A0AAV9J7B2_9PEZI|nr:hypothetical protein LTR36_009051 [Oleoguttula mirabilis]